VKIFISYSRRDAGDFANQINRHLSSTKHDIFTDVDDINAGEVWSSIIEKNISTWESNAYSLFVYAIRSQVTRDYYLRRLRIFFNHINLESDKTIEERCNYFANEGTKDPSWAFTRPWLSIFSNTFTNPILLFGLSILIFKYIKP
jgi:hypothetical protein